MSEHAPVVRHLPCAMTRRLRAAGAVLAAAFVALALAPAASDAATSCVDTANPVACENALPGTPTDQWRGKRAGDPPLPGFATAIRGDRRGTGSFQNKSATSHYTNDLY